MTFEPRIVAFLCTWCSYTGADTAGIARLKSPANLRAIRVPCSGRVSPELVMKAFDQGADGVLVLGCHIGECHYDTGNHRTAKRLPLLKELMGFVGLEPERLHLDWVSASEGERYSWIATEFVDQVRALGPVHWQVAKEQQVEINRQLMAIRASTPFKETDCASKTDAIRTKARELLASGQVDCVIGYEVGQRGKTRPAFIYSEEDADKLVWNPDCVYNLTTYLDVKLRPPKLKELKPVAIIVKPCDSRALNVQLAESQFKREQIHVIGVTCEGVRNLYGNLRKRCEECEHPNPVIYDTLVGEPVASHPVSENPGLLEIEALSPPARMEYWLSQFDRCIRCYACRQGCPVCTCPTCLYERDDSLWVGLGVGMNEKRAFHLGRAYHLAGRCIGCNECERACPMDIPISLLNMKLAQEMENKFGHVAGMEPVLSPVVTVLAGEYKEG